MMHVNYMENKKTESDTKKHPIGLNAGHTVSKACTDILLA